MSARKILLATAAATLALPLAACGSDSSSSSDKPEKDATPAFAKKSGDEIFTTATKAMNDTGPVRISGNMVDDGQPLELDVRTRGADACTGTVKQQGGTATFVVSSGATFIKGDLGFWKASVGEEAQQAMDYFGDKWVKAPSEDEFTQLCDVAKLLDIASAEDGKPRKIDVGKVSEIDGTQVVELTSVEDGQEFAVSVETASPHRIVRLVSKDPKDPGQITFDYDAKVEIDEPAKGEYVEIPAGS